LKNIIASNSVEETIRSVLRYWNIESSIDFVIGRNPQRRKKPEPDLFNDACSISGYPKNKIIVLEDSEIGLKAAYAAGCEAIWIRTVCNFHLSTAAPHLASMTHLEFSDIIRL
jgi:HAD superfamily hydrolase (TIGR01509 family)